MRDYCAEQQGKKEEGFMHDNMGEVWSVNNIVLKRKDCYNKLDFKYSLVLYGIS